MCASENVLAVWTAAKTRKRLHAWANTSLEKEVQHWQKIIDNFAWIIQFNNSGEKKSLFSPKRTEQLTSYQCVPEGLLDSFISCVQKTIWHVLVSFHSFVAAALSGYSECFDNRWCVQEKDMVQGLITFTVLMPGLPPFKVNDYHSSSHTLASTQCPRKPSLWASIKYSSNDKIVFVGSSAGWIRPAWWFLFPQFLRLVSVLRDELRCFSLLVSACSALQ